MKHSKEFMEKHALLMKKRAFEKAEKKIKKAIEKEEKRYENLRKRRKKYSRMKNENSDEYKSYLLSQRKYREKYMAIKNEKKKKIEQENDEYFTGYAKIRIKKMRGYYYIDKTGNIYNSKRQKMSATNTNGYLISCGVMVHRLVWMAFVGEIPDGMEIDHINCVRSDNRLENLRLVTHKENCNNPISIENYRRHNKQVDRSYLRKNNGK